MEHDFIVAEDHKTEKVPLGCYLLGDLQEDVPYDYSDLEDTDDRTSRIRTGLDFVMFIMALFFVVYLWVEFLWYMICMVTRGCLV